MKHIKFFLTGLLFFIGVALFACFICSPIILADYCHNNHFYWGYAPWEYYFSISSGINWRGHNETF